MQQATGLPNDKANEMNDLRPSTSPIVGSTVTAFEGFGVVLTALREQAGLTQREAGERSRLSHKTIAGYENERIEPSLSALDRLLPTYGISNLRELADAVDRVRGGTVAEAPLRYDAGDLASRDEEIARLRAEIDEANRALRKAVLGAGMISVGRED